MPIKNTKTYSATQCKKCKKYTNCRIRNKTEFWCNDCWAERNGWIGGGDESFGTLTPGAAFTKALDVVYKEAYKRYGDRTFTQYQARSLTYPNLLLFAKKG